MSDLIDRYGAITRIQHEYVDTEYGEDKCAVWLNVGLTKALHILRDIPSAQPETHEERTETYTCDCISRQAAINALTSHIMPHNNEDGTVTIGVLSKSSIKNILNKLPSAQPEHTNSWCINSWCIDCKEYDTENKCCPRYNRVIKRKTMRAIDGDRLKRKAQKVAAEAWKMKIKANVEVVLNQFIDWINEAPTIEPESQIIYSKAGYIMSLHKEYGCTLTLAEEAHNKALEYLRDKAMMKG